MPKLSRAALQRRLVVQGLERMLNFRIDYVRIYRVALAHWVLSLDTTAIFRSLSEDLHFGFDCDVSPDLAQILPLSEITADNSGP